MLKIIQQYRIYIHFDQFDETYELVCPIISAHNLVIGQMYIDIGDTMTVVNVNRPEHKCEVRFERRGWFTSEAFKFQGEAFITEGKKKNVVYTLEGNWNKDVRLTNL